MVDNQAKRTESIYLHISKCMNVFYLLLYYVFYNVTVHILKGILYDRKSTIIIT